MTVSLNKNYRWVLVTNLFVRNEAKVPNRVPEYSFQEIEEILLSLYDNDATDYLYQKQTKKMKIRDIQNVDDEYLCLLVSVGDKNVPDVSYESFPSGDIRTIEKEEDEGAVVTGHILIKKARETNISHLMLVEMVPGLNISKVEAYFRYLFKENSNKTYSNDGEHISYRPIFEVLGHQSSTIREAITNNTLQDIELVGHEPIDNDFDEHGYIQEQRKQAMFVVKRGIETDTADSFFEGLRNQFRDGNYEQMFVRIKTRNGQIKQTEVDIESEDMLSQAFICNEFVNDFDEPLESTSARVRNDMIEKLQETAAKYNN